MIQPFDKRKIIHIKGTDHPESIGIGPHGEAYTTGTGHQVYRIDLVNNQIHQIATTPDQCLGSAVDAQGNLYLAHLAGNVLKLTPEGTMSTYATGPQGQPFMCTNYPAFDRQGNMYLSDSGSFEQQLLGEPIKGAIYKIKPGGGEAERWYPQPLNTPNAIALDAGGKYLYFAETLGSSIIRIAINDDGSAGQLERVLYMARHIPDGIAFDTTGRLWIACHRPDAIYCFDPQTRELATFCEDWMGETLCGPTDISFAGPNRDVMLAASLDFLWIHRFDNTGVTGLKLNHPTLPTAAPSFTGQSA